MDILNYIVNADELTILSEDSIILGKTNTHYGYFVRHLNNYEMVEGIRRLQGKKIEIYKKSPTNCIIITMVVSGFERWVSQYICEMYTHNDYIKLAVEMAVYKLSLKKNNKILVKATEDKTFINCDEAVTLEGEKHVNIDTLGKTVLCIECKYVEPFAPMLSNPLYAQWYNQLVKKAPRIIIPERDEEHL
jgi:hypothetical protein